MAISILLDTSESVRSVSLEIIPGTPAENPGLPSFPTNENEARLLMYAVWLNVGATYLTECDWYDYREDKNVCSYCKCILGKCNVTEMQSRLAAITAKINEYNEQVAELTGKVEMLQTKVDDLTNDIVATKAEHKKRICELRSFIRSQPSEITEFDESLAKKLLEQVTVHDDYLELRFKSGVAVCVEK